MPVTISCPNPGCRHTANVKEEVLGRSVRCKRCGHAFVAHAAHDGDQSPKPTGSSGVILTALPAVPSLEIDASSIELGPDLPMAVFTSQERWQAERIGALALYCSDGRWGEAFDEFCHKHLQIPRYDRWAVPGGPGSLVRGDGDSDHNQAAREQIDFLVHNHKLEQVVLITHFGCAYYTHGSERQAKECLPEQARDIRAAANLLRHWYPDLRVQAFLAMRKENCLSFHGLEI